MQDVIRKILMSLIKKDQIIGFVFGVVIAVTASTLGMSQTEVKRAVCSAPEVQLPAQPK